MDIAKRLRGGKFSGHDEALDLMDKAADEIERLREALRIIGYGPPNEGEPLDLLNQFVDLARAALKGDE